MAIQHQSKIFGIGLDHTGTSQICHALAQLGYTAIHLPTSAATIAQFTAAAGATIALRFRSLDRQYPNSKFILTLRDIDQWLIAWQQSTSPQPTPSWMHILRTKLYGQQDFQPTRWRQVYEHHLSTATTHFRHRPHDLLILELDTANLWDTLCPFLNQVIPNHPFPPADPISDRQANILFFPPVPSAITPIPSTPTPLISVIVPTYNRLPHLDRALQSIWQQTCTDYEVIVIDDASTDGTSEWVQTTYPTITLITLPHNRGGAAARNVGIQTAMGTFLAFLDSDDEWLPDYLHQQVLALQRQPDCVLSYTDYISIIQGQPFGSIVTTTPIHTDLVLSMLLNTFIHTLSQVVVPKATFHQVGLLDETFRNCHDKEFYLRALAIGNPAHVDRYLVKKYWLPDGLVVQEQCTRWLTHGMKVIDQFFSRPQNSHYLPYRNQAEAALQQRVLNSNAYFQQVFLESAPPS